jgi:hypothetical protein
MCTAKALVARMLKARSATANSVRLLRQDHSQSKKKMSRILGFSAAHMICRAVTSDRL